ncbi:MAG: T9SS type A sorting domain-containing protein [Dysgonamonadaceae bacterium]|jgi:hypothetical protein|nr:T9SS type A sorting domain-containing protein [Dysgonamonadaceae bacterium]
MKQLFFIAGFLGMILGLHAQTQLIGPMTGVEIVYDISSNGRYVVGMTARQNGAGYVWDLQNPNNLVVFGTAVYSYGVTNNRLVAGNFNHTIDGVQLVGAGYSATGSTWVSLGNGLIDHPASDQDGTTARCISDDGLTIGGYSHKQIAGNKIVVPYSWTKNEANEWIGREWAYPNNIIQGSLLNLTADGQKAVGYVHNGFTRAAIYWSSPSSYELPFPGDEWTEYVCISANGKYAGFNVGGLTSGQTGVQNLETGEMTIVAQSGIINAVSNDGLAVGVYRPNGIEKPFVWSKKLGFMDFGVFMARYAPSVSIPSPLAAVFNLSSSNFSLNATVAPDGLTFALQATTTAMPRAAYVYGLKLAAPITIFPYPKNLTVDVPVADRNKVILNWEAPELEGETLTGYQIFRDAGTAPLVVTDANTLTYTDLNVPVGYHTYKVKALYGTETSNTSNTVQAMIVDNYQLPLIEDFKSLNLTKNFWTAVIDKDLNGPLPHLTWEVFSDAGVEETPGLRLYVTNMYGEEDQQFAGSLISKYLDGREAEHVYLSFLVKPNYYMETTLTPDTLTVDVWNGETWKQIDKYVFRLSMDWKAQILDLSPVAAGQFFKVRFRVSGENKTVSAKPFHFADIRVTTQEPNGSAIPRDLLYLRGENNSVQIAWRHPDLDLYALTYAQSPKRYSIGDGGKPFIAVNRFDAEDLVIYGDRSLVSVTTYINQKVTNQSVPTTLALAVFDGDTRIVDQPINNFTANAWNTFILNEPVSLKNKNLKFGLEVLTHDAKEEPVGADGTRNVVTGKGDLYFEDGEWKTLFDAGVVNNWCIIGNVADEANASVRNLKVVGYNIYRDGIQLNDDLIFGQSWMSSGENCFTVRAYSIDSSISAKSEKICVPIVDGISTIKANSFDVYPNPTHGMVTVQSENTIQKIQVLDVTGRVLRVVDSINGKETSVDLSALPNGIYLLNVDGKTIKVIKTS